MKVVALYDGLQLVKFTLGDGLQHVLSILRVVKKRAALPSRTLFIKGLKIIC